jgi:hypothetical protein
MRLVRSSGKAISITYTECEFVDLGIQHTKCTHHVVVCGLPGSKICLHIVARTARFSGKKTIERKICVLIFFYNLFSETFLILRRAERDMIKNVYRSSCKVPVILVGY